MIRIFVSGVALALAGSGAPMAQTTPHKTEQSQKIAVRLDPSRSQARVDAGAVPANVMLDANGRVVPFPVMQTEQDATGAPCPSGRKARPSDIRMIAENQAGASGLPVALLIAVIRSESRIGQPGDHAAATPRILPLKIEADRTCADLTAEVRRGVDYLRLMRERHPQPIHHLAAYHDGEEKFLLSGGVPGSPETLRFIISVMNELAGPIAELTALARRPANAAEALASRDTLRLPRSSERTPSTPDPRWVSGFVFNLE